MLSLQDYEKYLRVEQGLSESTVRGYIVDAERFIEWFKRKPTDATTKDLNDYKGHLLDQKFSKRSINRVMSGLRKIYGFLYEREVIETDPTSKIDNFRVVNKKIPQVLDEEEVIRIIKSIPLDSPKNIRDRAIISLLYGTGIRRAEMCGLRIDDITGEELRVREEIAKRGKERYIPLPSSVVNILNLYIDVARPNLAEGEAIDYLFFTPNKEKMYDTYLNRLLDQISEKTKAKQKLNPHLLRHSIATHLLENDVDLTDIQRLLGHSDLSTTEIYIHAKKEHYMKQIQSKHPLQMDLSTRESKDANVNTDKKPK